MTIAVNTKPCNGCDESNPELFSNLTQVDVNFSEFYCIGKPDKINEHFTVHLTKLTYLPKVADPRRDWVASVAVPAFVSHKKSGRTVTSFATVGTGSGLDAIGALEVFDLEKLAITDLHPAVVQAAAENIRAATAGQPRLQNVVDTLVSSPGDLLSPLADRKGEFDLIYENLPNIPLDPAARALFSGQTSSTYVAERHEKIVDVADESLLALHWLCMVQAKDLLAPGGSILSSMGGRVDISSMISMCRSAGYNPEVLIYTWKVQSEPEEVIGGYRTHQEKGHRLFYFYPADVLEEAFKGRSPAMTTAEALELEGELEPHRMDAVAAYTAHTSGRITVAHTVVVMRNTME